MDDCPVCEKMLLPGPFRIHIHLGTAKHIGMSLLKTVTVHELRDSKSFSSNVDSNLRTVEKFCKQRSRKSRVNRMEKVRLNNEVVF